MGPSKLLADARGLSTWPICFGCPLGYLLSVHDQCLLCICSGGSRDTMVSDTLLNAENGEVRIGIRPPRGELASQCVRHWQLACCSERRSGSIVAGALWPWLLQREPPGMSVQPCDANATVDHWQAQLALAWIIKPYFLIQAKFHPNVQPHLN